MYNVELLAPAGNFECAIAGFSYGADAIYLGLKNFSARADALNFSQKDLFAIVNFAHNLNKKVYVAINTLIQENELQDLLQALYLVQQSSADAVIVQDFGVVNIIKSFFPSIPIHASTQMAVHNLEGAIALKNLGFSRCVLARELSFEEIKFITSNCGIETEVFIHGALCYSYSGLCLYSSFLKGESANRGKCSYPCRKLYNGTHPFSMKDLCLGDDVKKLCEIGVASLKIEGRKKTPLYVASTTDYYRKIIDGKNIDGCIDNIKRIFARPFTKLHFFHKNKNVIDRVFSGPRGLFIAKVLSVKNNVISFIPSHPIAKHDGLSITVPNFEKPFGFALDNIKVNGKFVFSAEPGQLVEVKLPKNAPIIKKDFDIFSSSSMAVKASYPYKIPSIDSLMPKDDIDITCSLYKNHISASTFYLQNSISVSIEGDFKIAQNPLKMKEALLHAFSKLGDSSFNLKNLSYFNYDNVFVPISLLNDLRRKLIDKLQFLKDTYPISLPKLKTFQNNFSEPAKYIIKIDNSSYLQYFSSKDFDFLHEVIIDISSDFSILNPLLSKDKIRIAVPIIVRKDMMLKVKNKMELLISLGFHKFQISNIFGFELIKLFNINDWTIDQYIYTLNSYSIDFWKNLGAKRITLSVEDSKNNINLLLKNFSYMTDIILYQDTPLFIADNCTGNCKNCISTEFDIIKNCRHFILSDKPFCLIEKKNLLITPFAFRFDFCFKVYEPKSVLNIFHSLLQNKKPPSFTIANFDRGFK